MNNLSLYICLIFFILGTGSAANPNSNLLSLVQVFRHGERTPTSFYANDPYQDSSYWPVSEGQLTNTGKKEHFELGKLTRRWYKDFIPEKYTVEEVYIQTTDYDRTFMSAASNLAGLFPPVDDQIWNKNLLWHPITIHPVETATLSDLSTCSVFYSDFTEVLTTDPYFVAIDEENVELYEYLTDNSGSNITGLSNIYTIRDALYIEDRFNFTLPEWTNSIYPEPINNLTAQIWTGLGFTEKLRKLGSGVFLNALVEYFEDYLTNGTTTKYQQFSGHDTNIAAILHGLGAWTPQIPDFASTIYFELREISDIPYINVYFKNGPSVATPVPITVSGCDFDCSLEDFKAVLNDTIITAEEWYTLCESLY